ncbi:TetR/AcrR family transcriptional regulator [Roseomonas sp. NAR14]|uniref:TetR/AcrR family transcriptional regulator n=1 Tax=Roseomonas acroporae TaxID=2937791 RepID=A0A9X2C0G5_9PROT|nr:TetR/AcrR family transcriptional regulator [Roseomonas acroporae]MCK8788100.1 TetR/AcrR family transcriptional regulator [Roseomonas acroporae]
MDAALDQALLVFRERGYHAASLTELGAAMGLSSGSIYKAFVDKQALFRAAFDRYTSRRGAELRRAVDAERTGFAKIHAVLRFYAAASHGIEGRRGCLVAGGAAALASLDPDMARCVTKSMQATETLLLDLIRLGQADGSVPAHLDAGTAAVTLLCLLQGMRIVGKGGRTHAGMKAVADHALGLVAATHTE